MKCAYCGSKLEGRRKVCDDCKRAKSREKQRRYYAANREKARAKNREKQRRYRAANREKVREKWREYYRKNAVRIKMKRILGR